MTVDVFEGIYRRNGWRGTDSRSGPGSGFAPTRKLASWLLWLVEDRGIASVLDVGCGDCTWQPDLPGYLGIDVAPTAIRRARQRHPDRAFQVVDARDVIPPGPWDLVICRDVFQHLSLRDGGLVLDRIRVVGRRLLASTYVEPSHRHPKMRTVNTDIRTGDAYSNDLTLPPFDLPAPDLLFPDGWDYATGEEDRDPAKWLGLWDL